MAEPARADDDVPVPDLSRFVIEDEEPVDNLISEKEQRLLTSTLYASWHAPKEQGRTFAALSNVGLFYAEDANPYCPDTMVALDVHFPYTGEKKYLTYFVWIQGKPPDVAIEIVSNKNRHELEKIEGYARIGIPYYAIHDPERCLSQRTLRVFENHGGRYVELLEPFLLRGIGLGLVLWEGEFEGVAATWLRWCDLDGNLLPTAVEVAERAQAEAAQSQADAARAQAEAARAQAETAKAQAEAEKAQAEIERLTARLRALGIDPDVAG